MGYIKHNAIIVTGWDAENMETVREKAIDIFERRVVNENVKTFGSILISPIVNGLVDECMSFFIAPDGSKESFDLSYQCNDARTEFLNWMDSEANYCEYIEIAFGGDNSHTKIIRQNRNIYEDN